MSHAPASQASVFIAAERGPWDALNDGIIFSATGRATAGIDHIEIMIDSEQAWNCDRVVPCTFRAGPSSLLAGKTYYAFLVDMNQKVVASSVGRVPAIK